MPSRTRTLLEVAAILLLAVAAFAAWMHEHDQRLMTEAVNSQIEKDRAQAKVELDAKLAAIRSERDAIKTPEQAAKIINQYVPLPVPVHLDTATAELPKSLQDLPSAPVGKPLIIPAEDVVPAAKFVEDCRACQVEVTAVKADNRQLQTENSNLQTALKGGTFWQRFKKNIKWFAIGAGAGAVAGAVASRR